MKKAQKSLEALIVAKSLEADTRNYLFPQIPDILAEFTDLKTHNLIAILKLFEKVASDEFPERFGLLCAPHITEIFIGESTDLVLKNLLLNLTYKLLVSSESRKDPKVAKFFIGKNEVIKEICAQALKGQEDQISGVSFKILTILLVLQNKYHLVSEETVVVEEMDLERPLRRPEVVSLQAAKFLTMVLAESVVRPIVKFEGFSSEVQRDLVLYRIYDRIIKLHETVNVLII